VKVADLKFKNSRFLSLEWCNRNWIDAVL